MRTVLCFGDSNTHGTAAMADLTDLRRFDRAARWPNVMARRLGSGWDVIAEGQPGRNAVLDDPVEGVHKNGLRILPALLETHRPIDLVIVVLGTNDLKARFSLPASDIALGLERLVRVIAASDAGPNFRPPRVLLSAPVPIEEVGFLGDIFEGAAEKSRALPHLLAEVARRQGAGFIDLGCVAEVDPLDGIHLGAEGQAAVGRAMAEAVASLFNEEI